MNDGSSHREQTDNWLKAVPAELSGEQQLQRFEAMFNALIRRAQQTLGEVTLTAIVDRVVHLATEKFPDASALQVESGGVRCHALIALCRTRPYEQLVPLLRFVLLTFLTLLGNLTAEVLTPAMHAELMRGHDAAADLRRTEERSGDSQSGTGESLHEQG